MRRLALITLAATLGLAGTAHAGAGDDAYVVFTSIDNVPDGQRATGTAPCGANERAIGGGVRRTPLRQNVFVEYSAPFLSQAAPVAGQVPNQWRSRVNNLTGISSTFYAYSICSRSSDATLQAAEFQTTASTDGEFEGGGLASCPTGQRAIGGGVFVDEVNSSARLERSGPVDETGLSASTVDGDIARGWFGQVRTPAGGTTVRVYALCSATSLATVQVESLQMTPNSVSTGGLTVTCPSGQRALSGGVLANVDPHSTLSATTPTDSSGGLLTPGINLAGGWYTYINNYSVDNTFKVAVVCEGVSPSQPTPPTDPTDPTNPTTPPSNDFQIGGLARNRDRGTAQLSVIVPGAGSISLESPKLKPQDLPVPAAGEYQVKVKAVGNARKKLRRKGKVKSTAAITFAPAGGTPASQSNKLKLIRD